MSDGVQDTNWCDAYLLNTALTAAIPVASGQLIFLALPQSSKLTISSALNATVVLKIASYTQNITGLLPEANRCSTYKAHSTIFQAVLWCLGTSGMLVGATLGADFLSKLPTLYYMACTAPWASSARPARSCKPYGTCQRGPTHLQQFQSFVVIEAGHCRTIKAHLHHGLAC